MSMKRKVASGLLARRVRPRREDDWEPEADPSSDGSSASEDDDEEVSEEEIQHGNGQHDPESSEEDGSGDDSDDDGDNDGPAKVDISSISFGALARAQASLPASDRKSKSDKITTDSLANAEDRFTSRERPADRRSKKDIPKPKRTSKHAPLEQTSKKPVSRRREVVSLPEVRRAAARDPRFDPIAEGRLDEVKARKAYAFLEEYRDREIADLKAQLKKTKDVSQKEVIKKEIMSMESRKKARRAKEDEEKLLAEHKKKEKELVAQGKKPFYLKKSDQKKQLLTHRYESMSKGQVDKSIQRKRKKVAGREKKELDFMQRVTDRRNR